MRHVPLVIALLTSACGSNPPTAFPIADLSSREGALQTGALIADLRVDAVGLEAAFSGVEWAGSSFLIYPVTINSQLVPRGDTPIGADMRMAMRYTYGTIGEPHNRRVDWQLAYGVNEVVPGNRYLAVFAGTIHGHDDVRRLIMLRRIDASGRLLDAALGFPPGTPVSTVLDPEGIPAWILNGQDAGAPSDG